MRAIDEFIKDMWPVGAAITVLLFIGAIILWQEDAHNRKYKCLKGHEETIWQYTYGANGTISGAYPVSTFVCDYEILRDSIK